jgi:hypothetical protein
MGMSMGGYRIERRSRVVVGASIAFLLAALIAGCGSDTKDESASPTKPAKGYEGNPNATIPTEPLERSGVTGPDGTPLERGTNYHTYGEGDVVFTTETYTGPENLKYQEDPFPQWGKTYASGIECRGWGFEPDTDGDRRDDAGPAYIEDGVVATRTGRWTMTDDDGAHEVRGTFRAEFTTGSGLDTTPKRHLVWVIWTPADMCGPKYYVKGDVPAVGRALLHFIRP